MIDEFTGTINRTGIARQNRFEAQIYYPAALGGATNRDVNLRIKTVEMPGRNLTSTTNDTIYGPTHEVATGLTFADEITITFHLSPDFNEKRWIDTWQELVYNPRTYELGFYNDYISTIEIYQLGHQDERLYGVKLTECFPKTVSPITYTQDGVSALHELSVGFAFKEWEILDVTSGNPVRANPKDGGNARPPSIGEDQPSISKKKSIDMNYTPNRYTTPEERNKLPDMTVDTMGGVE